MFRKKLIVMLLSSFISLTAFYNTTTVSAAAANGWQLSGTSWYYFINGSKSKGWLYWNSKWYYLNSGGDMASNQWIAWNGKQYYLNAGGDMAVNTVVDGWTVGLDGAWDGRPQTVKVNNKGYVYNPEVQIDLKVRSAPDLNGSVLGYLYNFEKIEILDTVTDSNKNVWDKIMYENSTAYVSDAYIQHYDSPPDNVVNIAVNISRQFETGALNQIAGNFDGEGLSLGYLQWCIGQGTIQPILNRMDREYNSEMRTIFGSNYGSIHDMLNDSSANQLKWAESINDSSNNITGAWHSQFITLCTNPHFISIEKDAEVYFVKQAMLICDKYNLKTIRGFALAFDIVVQNGGISSNAASVIDAAKAQNSGMTEKKLIGVIANAVSENNDILSRKTAILNGQGIVHGSMLYLDSYYDLSDSSWR